MLDAPWAESTSLVAFGEGELIMALPDVCSPLAATRAQAWDVRAHPVIQEDALVPVPALTQTAACARCWCRGPRSTVGFHRGRRGAMSLSRVQRAISVRRSTTSSSVRQNMYCSIIYCNNTVCNM